MRKFFAALTPRVAFLRIPLLGWLALLIFSWKDTGSFGHAIFEVEPREIVTISTFAFLTAAICLLTLKLIAFSAMKRYGLNIPLPPAGWLLIFAHIAPVALLVSLVTAQSKRMEDPYWQSTGLALLGWALAVLVVFIAHLFWALFTADEHGDAIKILIWPGSNWVFDWALAKDFRPVAALRKGWFAITRLPLKLADPLLDGYKGTCAPAHTLATFVVAATLVAYVFFAWAQESVLDPATHGWIRRLNNGSSGAFHLTGLPALGWILILVMLFVSVLSFLTFFFDRYRVPMLLFFIAMVMFTSNVPESDQFYEFAGEVPNVPVVPDSDPRPSAIDALGARPKIILIAAPGGGIQSAAWTTKVIKELSSQVPGFMSSVGAISGISGGSVGIFHLAASRFNPDAAYEAAKRSSIDDVAWALAFHDLLHITQPWFWPFHVRRDRGWALERSLERNAAFEQDKKIEGALVKPGKPFTVFDPRIKPDDRKPTLIMSATVLESGAPIVFSTSKFSEWRRDGKSNPCIGYELPSAIETTELLNDDKEAAHKRLHRLDPIDHYTLYKREINLSTAARLSAAFPFVSPAARTFRDRPGCPDFHLIDGGYYDNPGVSALLKWLEAALDESESPRPARDVLLIQIEPRTGKSIGASKQGWEGEIMDPLAGLLNSHFEGQLLADRYLLELFRRAHRNDITLRRVAFQFEDTKGQVAKDGGSQCGALNLSWKLTLEEKRCLDRQHLNGESVTFVKEFLGVKSAN